MYRARLLLSLLALVALLTGLLPAVSGVQALSRATRQVVRIGYDGSPQIASELAGRYDVWEVQPEKGFVVALVSAEEEAELRAAGYQIEVERVIDAGINAPLDPRYYYFDNYVNNPNNLYIVDLMDQVAAAYPDITELTQIGMAWEGLHGGYARPLLVLRITNEDPAFGPIDEKPAFFLHANVHAREVTTPELAIRYIKHLTSGYLGQGGYGIDPDVTWLVDWYRVYVEVTTNPDGLAVNEADSSSYRRKNMDSDDGCSDPNNWGVDLNRNHSFKWGCCGGSSPLPCDETYRGPARASEPETDAFQTFILNSVFIDQNGPNGDDELPPAAPLTTTGILLSLHSYADEVLWPWGFPPYDGPPNYTQLRSIGRKLASINGMSPAGTVGYVVDGGTRDWIYGKLGIPAYTFEVGPGSGICGDFIPSFDCQDGINGAPRNFWAENRPAFIYMHKLARTPYMSVYGPDATNVAATPTAVLPGDPTQVSALVVDQRYNGDPLQPVAGAEYFVDAPGDDGAGASMSPADGAWGETSEEAVATLDTSGLSLGRHYVLVHGRNSNGDWGPYTAAFLYVVEPGVSPTIEGYVRDSATNAPLDATVTAGVFSANTDPATGYYSMTVVSGTYDMTARATGYADGFAYDVVAHDYQTVQQPFMLDAICQAFADDVENGQNGWITGGTPNNWAITTEDSHSPTHSWTDSPGGSYSNGANTWVQSPPLDLTDNGGIALNFWHKYVTESGYDYVHVEYSTNGGSTWAEAASYSGNQSNWSQLQLAIPALDHQPNARLRFRLTADGSVTGDGWHIDDITLLADSGCAPLTPPIAEFYSNSPVMLGDPMLFTNGSSGNPPPTYEWDFGDGVGTSTDPNPSYTYTAAGTYVVTLVATNSQGSDSVTHTVQVLLPEPPVAGFISNSPVVLGDPMVFTNTSTGDPLPTYEWNFGDGIGFSTQPDPTYTYLSAGSFLVTLTATNPGGSDTVSQQVQVIPPACVPVSNAGFTWAPATPPAGLAVSFSGSASGDEPIAYEWAFGDGSAGSGISPTHAYATGGIYTVVMTASNCLTASAVVSHDLTVVAPHIAVSPVPTVTIPIGVFEEWPLVLTNTGDYTLTWALAEAAPLDWLTEAPTAGILAAGEAQSVTLGYTAPMTPGIYSGVLQVTSDDPLQPQLDVTVVLIANDLPPYCDPATGPDFTWSPAAPYLTDTVTLTATVAGGDAPLTYTWGLGDGTTTTGAVITHAYAAAGTYSVLLSVTNCDGTTVVTATHEIEVREVIVPPTEYLVYLPIVVKN